MTGPLRYRLPPLLLILSLAGPPMVCRGDDPLFAPAADVLSRRCLSCHNAEDRKGDFSLETREQLIDSGYLAPGDGDGSQLLAAIVGDGDDPPRMPQDAEPLSGEEVAAVRAWIDGGAPWPGDRPLRQPAVRDFSHWSLQPLAEQEVPAPQDAEARTWIRSPVDAFVLRRLRKNGLRPSPEADRRTLIRRLTYDLTGLPPTPEQVRRFVEDSRPRAYQRLIDRLLASPRYGERWGRHWLDVVKYADTCGYDKDKLRPNAWPYRDYVIRSFNEDKPYRRFVREQLAGDVLYGDTPDGVLGLGFIAAGPWDFIGHVEVPESKIDGKVARNLDRDEMASNTLNTFCSVTIQCARCHNHKFDPFTQEHYYSLQAVFAAVDRAERPYDEDMSRGRRRAELARRRDDAARKLAAWERETRDAGGERLADLDERLERLRERAEAPAKRPEFGYHSAIAARPEEVKWVAVDLGREVEVRRIVLRPCHDDFNDIGAGFGFPVRYAISAAPAAGAADEDRQLLVDRSGADQANPGLAPLAFPVEAKARFIRVTAARLARRSNDYIFALAELQVLDAAGENVAAGAAVRAKDSIEAPVRWAAQNLTDEIWARAADPAAAAELAEAEAERARLYQGLLTPDRRQRRRRLQQVRAEAARQLQEMPPAKMVYAAATEFPPQGNFRPTMGSPRPVAVLHRGDVQKPRQAVAPGRLPLRPDDRWRLDLPPGHAEGDRRAALADWIVRDDHPLTWRSIANRLWLYHFGQGIVSTPNDFGRMGRPPSHPQLLDFLAGEVRGGQSLKRIHRMIVSSSAYRQSSAHDAEKAAIDSGNRLLWRMNRRRLEAEEIRDSVLDAAGRLDLRMGGPGFHLFVLEKTAHSPHYEYHKFDPEDPASQRRSVYRFVVRSQPDPYMTTLDCADSSQSTPRRDETLTSLQALSLLNNRFTLTMSRHFAGRLRREREGLAAQIERGVELTWQRRPDEQERTALAAYAERHGLANLCRLLLNCSEFVYLD